MKGGKGAETNWWWRRRQEGRLLLRVFGIIGVGEVGSKRTESITSSTEYRNEGRESVSARETIRTKRRKNAPSPCRILRDPLSLKPPLRINLVHTLESPILEGSDGVRRV
jgi:hypothetical protein